MAEYITKVRTENGDMQIDYNALANKPTASSIGAAPVEHRHIKSDISDFPTSLPANGGNADTLDNKHASDFALASNVEAIASDVNTVKTNVETIVSNVGTIQTNIETIQKDIYESTFNLSTVVVTTEELNYVKGVTSSVQEQLDDKAESVHEHGTEDITSGILPITRGGTGASDGATGLKNLFASDYTILSKKQFGEKLPGDPDGFDPSYVHTAGVIFFKKI